MFFGCLWLLLPTTSVILAARVARVAPNLWHFV